MASSTLNIPQADKLSRDTLISKTITALRWPLAFLVVLDHYFRLYLVEDSLGYNLENPQLISGIEAFIISFLKNYPVPVFFFISGYLLYLGNLSLCNNYRAKLKKFPREIIFPYIFWTMYAIAVAFIIGLSRGMESQSLLHIPGGGKFLPGPNQMVDNDLHRHHLASKSSVMVRQRPCVDNHHFPDNPLVFETK